MINSKSLRVVLGMHIPTWRVHEHDILKRQIRSNLQLGSMNQHGTELLQSLEAQVGVPQKRRSVPIQVLLARADHSEVIVRRSHTGHLDSTLQ